MNHDNELAALAAPRWNNGHVLFEIDVAGGRVSCAISRGALEDLTQKRLHRPADILAQFMRVRRRIEKIASAKLIARHQDIPDRLNLWADDMDELPAGDSKATFRERSAACAA